MKRLDAAIALAAGAFILADVHDAEQAWSLPLMLALPLAFRSVAPLAVIAVMCLGYGAYGAAYGDPDSVSLLPPMLLGAYSVGAHVRRRRAWAGAAVMLAFAWSVAFTKDSGAEDLVFVAVLLGLPWGAGLLARDHARRAERLEGLAAALEAEQREHERLLLTVERSRIAAELNDAVAHSVSAMTMQANAAAAALERDPDAARAALREVQASGREALLELRRMLGLLREPAL